MIHKMKGKPDHRHDTVAEARSCEELQKAHYVPTTTVTENGLRRPARHQDPCRCGPYDRCWEFRVATARTWRDLFRSYCD